jgi:hypothetical protein
VASGPKPGEQHNAGRGVDPGKGELAVPWVKTYTQKQILYNFLSDIALEIAKTCTYPTEYLPNDKIPVQEKTKPARPPGASCKTYAPTPRLDASFANLLLQV